MTPEEFKNEMERIKEASKFISLNEFDPEVFHSNADTLMCRLLTELGYGEGVDIFERTEKYYS